MKGPWTALLLIPILLTWLSVLFVAGCGLPSDTTSTNIAEAAPALFPAFECGPAFEGGLWVYIDKTGKWVIQPTYFSAGPFSDGLAAVQPTGEAKYGYIDASGKMVIGPEYFYAGRFSNGLAPVMPREDGKYGYIDLNGKMLIQPQYDSAMEFGNDGLASVTVGDSWGFIDKTGAWVLQPRYDFANDFSEGLAAVVDAVNNPLHLFGFIDKTGRWAIRPQYDDVGFFSGGLA
jgi:hypothetical protein